MTFGQRVKSLRIQKGVSVEWVAGHAGLGYRTVLNVEADNHNATYKTICAIAAALDVEPAELLKEPAA